MLSSAQRIHGDAESGRETLEGEDVRQGCEALLPPAEMERLGAPWGVITRQRQTLSWCATVAPWTPPCLERGHHPRPLRLGGVPTPNGSGVFRTHLPPRIGPWPVADRDRGRWEVALSLRLATSGHRLAQVDAERPCPVKTLRQASLIAASIAARLAQPPTVQTRPQQAGAHPSEAPRQPRRLALPLAVACPSSAPAVDLQAAAAERRWGEIAAWLTSAGRAPNGRRRPSVGEQLRGGKRQPAVRKTAGNHH